MNKIKTILKDEFISGKTWFDWSFLAVGLILQTIAIVAGFVSGEPESIGMIISGLAGVISVVLCSQGKISFYLFGFIQLFTYVFCFSIPNNLHGETIENGMYFITMLYGIYAWAKRYGRNEKTESLEVHAHKFGVVGNTVTAGIFVVGVIAYYIFLKNVPMFGVMDSDPFVDSITSVPAYIAQIFMVLGFREQWIYWLILDVGSVVLAIRAGSLIMTAQFIFWTLNCIYGFVNWTKLSNKKPEKKNAREIARSAISKLSRKEDLSEYTEQELEVLSFIADDKHQKTDISAIDVRTQDGLVRLSDALYHHKDGYRYYLDKLVFNAT